MIQQKKKKTGYDKHVDWKTFGITTVLFFLILFLPTSHGMKDAGAEYAYKVGTKAVINFLCQELSKNLNGDVEQSQMIGAQITEQNMWMDALTYILVGSVDCREYKEKVG